MNRDRLGGAGHESGKVVVELSGFGGSEVISAE